MLSSVDLGVDVETALVVVDAGGGGAGVAGLQIWPHQLTLFHPEADYAHHITTCFP